MFIFRNVSLIVSGGKNSGIFGEPGAPSTRSKPVHSGRAASNIFGDAESTSPSVKGQHPNKPKVDQTLVLQLLFFLEQQISILEWFLKDHVTLE